MKQKSACILQSKSISPRRAGAILTPCLYIIFQRSAEWTMITKAEEARSYGNILWLIDITEARPKARVKWNWKFNPSPILGIWVVFFPLEKEHILYKGMYVPWLKRYVYFLIVARFVFFCAMHYSGLFSWSLLGQNVVLDGHRWNPSGLCLILRCLFIIQCP